MNYAHMAATAKRLIEKNGRACTFARAGRVAADPTKPWNGATTDPSAPSGAPVSYTGVKAVIDALVFQDGAGDSIRSDKKFTVLVAVESFPDDAVDLSTLDTVNDGFQTYKITSALPLMPGDTDIILTMTAEL